MKEMAPLANAHIGLSSFFASAHPIDMCGTNGLPLTPNSINIFGRFQELTLLQHPNLCQYIDIIRGKQERLIVVAEYHELSLASQAMECLLGNVFDIQRVAHELMLGLEFLHQHGYTHRNLSTETVLMDAQGIVKVAKFGLYHMTHFNAQVAFPIGDIAFMPPEVALAGPGYSDVVGPCKTSVDVWSLGMVLLDCFLDGQLWGKSRSQVDHIVSCLISLLEREEEFRVLEEILRVSRAKLKYQEMDKAFHSFLTACLQVDPARRPTVADLLKHEFIKCIHDPRKHSINGIYQFPSVNRSSHLTLPNYNKLLNDATDRQLDDDPLSERPIDEVFYFWTLTGGDVFAELKKHGMLDPKPAVLTLPNTILNNGEEFDVNRDKILMYNDSTISVSLGQLRKRLEHINPRAYYPLVVEDDLNPVDTSEALKLPVVIREKDVEYQFHRIILFERLLEGYPHTRERILKEARVDIPPPVRARVWAALLNVTGDIYEVYDRIDKESITLTDRQIEVDVPRCHQYSNLLSSQEAHQKLKRVLKAWVVSHPHLVYWQGLDSLCAPFVALNFNNEALAYACLSAFIPKYLYNFFLKDNSQVIHEYLAVFSQLVAFHDPDLFNHLLDIGFQPELYAIPWFLTMFSHVFPLQKIYLLWDTLLLGSSLLPLCIGVSILLQFREQLLSFGFNECILLFSDMPTLDIERCVRDSIKLFNHTPPSAAIRKQDNVENRSKAPAEESFMNLPEKEFLPLAQLRSEICVRISARDLVRIAHLVRQTPSVIPRVDVKDVKRRGKIDKGKATADTINKLIVVDVRSTEEFAGGHFPYSVNVPFSQAVNDRKELVQSSLTLILESHKGRMVMIVGNKGSEPVDFGHCLVKHGYRRVCVMDGSVSILRACGFLSATS